MKNIEKFKNKWITSSVVLIVMLSSFALLGGVFGTGAPPFTVTFEEHNLPVGTTWSIAWNNTTKSGIISNTTYSGGGSASVSLYNGSYEFRVIGTPWWFNKTIGKFTVAGASLRITVNFTENFTLNIAETGWSNHLLPNQKLASGYSLKSASWGIKINGVSYSTTANYQNIKLPASTYNLNILNSTISVGGTGLPTYNIMEYISNVTNQNIILNSNKTISISYSPYVVVGGGGVVAETQAPSYDITFYNNEVIPDGSPPYLIPYNLTITYSLSTKTYSNVLLNATGFDSTTFNGIVSNTSVSQISYNSNHTFANVTAHVYGPFDPYIAPVLTTGIQFTPGVIFEGGILYWNSMQEKYFLNFTSLAQAIMNNQVLQPNEIQNATAYISVYPDETLVEYGRNVSIPNGTYLIDTKMDIFNHIIYYNDSVFGFHANPKIITIQGYVNPHNATIFNIYSSYIRTVYQNTSSGYYNLTMPANDFVLFYGNDYIPQVFFARSSEWLNVTLQKYNFPYNITSSIFNYSYNKGGILNFSKMPVKASIMSSIMFYKISNNTFYISSNLSADVVTGQPYLANAPLHIILPVLKDRKYLLSIETNLTTQPYYNFTFNTTNNAYYNLTYNWWSIDPTISYYAYPVAVISAPSAIPYDTAITISGADSIASTNATITNYTWHITGPVSYTAYGKQIDEFFSVPGTYKIELTVTDSNGLTNTTSTTLSVLASNSTTAIKISVTHTFNSQRNTYYFLVYVNMTNNVSISQITVSVDGKFVNATLYKEMGYDYIYAFNLSNEKYGYGNHTIKIMVFDTLGQYNSLTTYLVFGSVSGVGIISYIFTNTLLLVATAFVILAILVFLYSVHERDEMKSRPRKRSRGRK